MLQNVFNNNIVFLHLSPCRGGYKQNFLSTKRVTNILSIFLLVNITNITSTMTYLTAQNINISQKNNNVERWDCLYLGIK